MARILIVEDDEDLRLMLRRLLEGSGYEVAEARNGKEGLRLFRARGADLVITDIIMPEVDGLETILEIRRNFPGVKIIAISGGTKEIGRFNFLLEARMFGAIRTFQKPLNLNEILEAVKALLGQG